jgi:hypothetical protein
MYVSGVRPFTQMLDIDTSTIVTGMHDDRPITDHSFLD